MRLVRRKLTYANVVSTLCLILVVGGGSAYAGFQLGKESVDTKQLAQGAVTPSKLSRSAKSALAGPAGKDGARGATGPQGPQGVKGEPGQRGETGASPVTFYAVIGGGGGIIRDRGVETAVRYTTGDYAIEFIQDVNHCTWTSTLGVEGGAPDGQIGTTLGSENNATIGVQTFAPNGNFNDFPFQLLVFC